MDTFNSIARTALVVDDNRINRRVASVMLQRMGFASVAEAENGFEALELFKAHHYQLVLMDLEMPHMNGVEAARQIRLWESAEQRASTPIIALTAGSIDEQKGRCLECGMDDFLTKPLQFEALEGVVEGVSTRMEEVRPTQDPARLSNKVPAVDDERFDKMCLLLRDGVGEFYHDFLLSTGDKIAQIESHPHMPVETSTRLIHSIRGSASNVGAMQLELLAEHLEQRLEAGEQDVLYCQIASLREVVEQFAQQVDQRLASR